MDERETRIADNEGRFRMINERLEADLRALHRGDGEHFAFVCECGLRECRDTVELSFAEYERVRADPLTFAIRPGHQIEDVEDVLARTERFWTIRKHERTADSLVERDPRRQS